jgi:BirA family transcriptional regulator, biotin operon repressor / biotin---[acetyl-CoA-carboxylase] ligase
MKHIKLNAISSTNDFLKVLLSQQHVENFTVISAKEQTSGKGQMGATWTSEKDKNLTMTLLIKDLITRIDQMFSLNKAVAVGIINALETYPIKGISIKWPNDIMSGNKKIGGVLIENIFKSSGEIVSVVGVGINVNQSDFKGLRQASSLHNLTGELFDVDLLLNDIVTRIKHKSALLMSDMYKDIDDEYHQHLFKINTPMPFETHDGERFMGIIQKVDDLGKLWLMDESDTLRSFSIKEIKLLYH